MSARHEEKEICSVITEYRAATRHADELAKEAILMGHADLVNQPDGCFH